MRGRLVDARKKKGMTQQEAADKLGMTLRNYQRIERGEIIGTISTWDSLEDFYHINQRKLRELSDTRPARGGSP